MYYLTHFFPKSGWKLRNFGPGGAHPLRPCPDPPMNCHDKFSIVQQWEGWGTNWSCSWKKRKTIEELAHNCVWRPRLSHGFMPFIAPYPLPVSFQTVWDHGCTENNRSSFSVFLYFTSLIFYIFKPQPSIPFCGEGRIKTFVTFHFQV